MLRQFKSIQVLRGIAALLILYAHTSVYIYGQEVRLGLKAMGELQNIWGYFGVFGVDIFFVISGFIILFISKDAFGKEGSSWKFIKNRIIRIGPMYWIFTIIAAIQVFGYLFLKQAFPHSFSANPVNLGINWQHFLESMLLIPTYNINGGVGTTLRVGWTLLFEVFFYFIFALILTFSIKKALLILTGIFTILITMGLIFTPSYDTPVIFIYTNPLLIEFLCGVFIAYFYINHKIIPFWVASLSVIAGTLALILEFHTNIAPRDMYDPARIIYFGIPSILIVSGLINLEVQKRFTSCKLLEKTGDCSYILYLSHLPIAQTLGKILVIMGALDIIPPSILISIIMIFCIIIAWFLHIWLEKPITKLLKQKFN